MNGSYPTPRVGSEGLGFAHLSLSLLLFLSLSTQNPGGKPPPSFFLGTPPPSQFTNQGVNLGAWRWRHTVPCGGCEPFGGCRVQGFGFGVQGLDLGFGLGFWV